MKPEYDAIVIGGGPAGSTVASFLAQKKHRVLLLEKEKFPRYHIGESLVTGVMPILKELDVLDKVEAHGFTKKYGVTFLWGESREKPWTVFFGEGPFDKGAPKYSFQVVRSEFDNILLRHSESLGVDVREEHKVVETLFENERCVGVKYQQPDGTVHEARAHYTIDASGQSAVLGRYLSDIEYDDALKNVATWSYYKNANRFEGVSSGNVLVENTPEGWVWFIPLHGGITSVGWVASMENLKNSKEKDLQSKYTQVVNSTVEARRLLDGAERSEKVYTTRDWSYKCKKFYGPGYLLVGDAAGFVDPLFATGVFLAMNAATLGAKMLNKALENPELEEEFFAKYEHDYRGFLGTVTSFVHYFYDASRERDSYFLKAQELVDPIKRMHARHDFVLMISGLSGLQRFGDNKAPISLNHQGTEEASKPELLELNK